MNREEVEVMAEAMWDQYGPVHSFASGTKRERAPYLANAKAALKALDELRNRKMMESFAKQMGI